MEKSRRVLITVASHFNGWDVGTRKTNPLSKLCQSPTKSHRDGTW